MGAVLDALQFAILPVFAFPAIGFAFGLRGAFGRVAAEGVNAYVVGLAVPCLLFRLMATVDLGGIDWPVLLAYEASLFLLYGFGYIACRHGFRLAPPEALILGLAGAFPNHVFFALPIAQNLYGEGAAAPVATMIAVDTLGIFVATILILEAMTGKAGVAATLRSIAANRLILAILAGFAFNLSGLALHEGVDRFLGLAAGSAAPASLFALGVILSGADLKRFGGPALAATGMKCVVHPLLGVVLLGAVVEPSAAWAGPAPLVFAAPCGAMAFVLGLRYGVKVDSAAKAVILSTALSVPVTALFA